MKKNSRESGGHDSNGDNGSFRMRFGQRSEAAVCGCDIGRGFFERRIRRCRRKIPEGEEGCLSVNGPRV